jgi:hypothetical protein
MANDTPEFVLLIGCTAYAHSPEFVDRDEYV